jgi:hypothetical protein
VGMKGASLARTVVTKSGPEMCMMKYFCGMWDANVHVEVFL